MTRLGRWWRDRERRLFRRLVRHFLARFELQWMIKIIWEEQREIYYEDGFLSRRQHFEDCWRNELERERQQLRGW